MSGTEYSTTYLVGGGGGENVQSVWLPSKEMDRNKEERYVWGAGASIRPTYSMRLCVNPFDVLRSKVASTGATRGGCKKMGRMYVCAQLPGIAHPA